ncbi:MAG: cytochrome C oxidase subunit IV family protein [Sulfurimonas sp.]
MTKKLELVWIVLIVFTIFAFLLGKLELVNSFLVSVLLLTTFIKGQLVIDYFMGLKDVKLKYRLIPTIWLGVVVSLIAVAYYLPVSAT